MSGDTYHAHGWDMQRHGAVPSPRNGPLTHTARSKIPAGFSVEFEGLILNMSWKCKDSE